MGFFVCFCQQTVLLVPADQHRKELIIDSLLYSSPSGDSSMMNTGGSTKSQIQKNMLVPNTQGVKTA